MELEQLTKSQTVLLTLLVSFVTSIATGIVTVSLLDQAPPAVTQTINRVVERTVETVAPPTQTQAASVVTKETTVVVKEEDLITDSVTKNLGSLVKLYQGTTSNQTLGVGVLVGSEGVVAVDAKTIADDGVYLVVLADSSVYEASIASVHQASGLAFLVPLPTAKVPTLTPAKLGASTNTKLGQTVLALSSAAKVQVSQGILSSFDSVKTDSGASALFLSASISGDSPQLGTPLLNIFGEVIGITTSVSKGMSNTTYASSDAIASFLSAKASAQPKVEKQP